METLSETGAVWRNRGRSGAKGALASALDTYPAPAQPATAHGGPGVQALIFRRVIEELCKLVGSDCAENILRGQRLRIGDQIYAFIHDDDCHPELMFVYVELGCQASDTLLRQMMMINFDLAAASKGVLCMHPESGRLFYASRYRLDMKAKGSLLLEGLMLALEQLGETLLDMQCASSEAGLPQQNAKAETGLS